MSQGCAIVRRKRYLTGVQNKKSTKNSTFSYFHTTIACCCSAESSPRCPTINKLPEENLFKSNQFFLALITMNEIRAGFYNSAKFQQEPLKFAEQAVFQNASPCKKNCCRKMRNHMLERFFSFDWSYFLSLININRLHLTHIPMMNLL